MGKKASIECALRRLDRDAEEEKAKCECMEMALADYQAQLNRPFEHEERLRALCLRQQELNRQLDLDKGGAQAVANDSTPQEEEAVGTFVERLTARRIERWQRIDLEVCPVPRTLNIKIGVDKEQMEFYPLEWKCLLN